MEEGMKFQKILRGLSAALLSLSAGLFFINDARCGEVIELKISHHGPTSWVQQTDVFEPWAKKIEGLTNGRVKFIFYPKESLGKAAEQYDLTLKGIADIALGLPDYTPGRFPLVSCMKLPFLGAHSGEGASLVLWRFYQKYLQDEFKDAKVLWMFCNGPFQLHTINKEVKSLEDLKGLRLRAGDPTSARALELLGATAVTCSTTDGYQLMKEGKLDGTVIPWEGALNFKYLDFCKYHTIINMYVMPFYAVMNKDKYASLPEDIKKIIDENIGEKMAAVAGRAMDKGDIMGKKLAEERGDSIYYLPGQELGRWKRIVMPVGDAWVEEVKVKGLPGDKALAYVIDLFIQLQK
jgi:TRAP-type transport system periplasmic protein